MKVFNSLFSFLLIFFLIAGTIPASAFDQYESMKVGETKTFYFPSEVTSRAGSMYAYNCSSDHINNVEVVSYTNTSVTVKALAYTQSQVNIRFDYWWYENNYSRNDTHMVHIDLNDNSSGSSSSLNPRDYFFDYGCWGTIDIEVGSTKTVYCQYDIPNQSKVVSIDWTEYLSAGFEITSQSSSSCTIKGRFPISGETLWCLMKYGNSTYKAYYTINVKESSKPTLTLSANVAGGNVEKGTKIYLTASQSDANIYYTLNGSNPTSYSTRYTSSGITIDESCTLKAVAMKSGYNNSAVMTWIYSVETKVDPTNISVSPSSKTIKVGETFTPTYSLTPSNATTTVTWSSDDSSIASVDKNTGKVTGIKAGSTYINATTANGKESWCRVTVEETKVDPTSISVSPSSKTIKVGETFTPTYSLTPSNATTTVTWSSDDSSIASVDKNTGKVTGIKAGSTYINATTANGKKNWCRVMVEKVEGIDINETNFPDANFRNYLLAQDYGKDGILTETEIKGIKTIVVDNKDISSLKGIEHFTALTGLDCGDSQLTALDVSKNTELEILYCYSNQLTALDVSKNTELKILWCSSNQLTALDVSKNTALIELDCIGNQLTALDVSKNTALTGLWCSSNQLTALDVSKNTALIRLYCEGNMIKGTAMDALINSLHQNTTNATYYIGVYDETIDTEGNVCTKKQVEVAKAKGWTPQYFTGFSWLDYEGSDDETNNVASLVMDADEKSPVYNLSGQQVKHWKGKKGIYIVNGKKIVVK